MKNSPFDEKLWEDFRGTLTDLTGIFLQAYDNRGRFVGTTAPLPPLCALFDRHAGMKRLCLNDCHRSAARAVGKRKIVSGRCHAGLSFRIVPIVGTGGEPLSLMVGRVFIEISGDEHWKNFARRHRLDKDELTDSLRAMRHLSEAELDRTARLLRRLVRYQGALDRRVERRGSAVLRSRQALDFTSRLWSQPDGGHGAFQRPLEMLASLLHMPKAALIIWWPDRNLQEVVASIGCEGEGIERLAAGEWSLVFGVREDGSTEPLVISDAKAARRMGLKSEHVPLVASRLVHGEHDVGYLLFPGGHLEERDKGFFSLCCRLLAPRIDYLRNQWILDRRTREMELLGRAGESIFSARGVEKILPRALDEAMELFRSRRGSIILGDIEQGRLNGVALKGAHAELAGSLKRISPGSVTERVFRENQPILVQDAGRQNGSSRKREYPFRSRSFMSVPIRTNGKAIGVFNLTDRESDEVFTDWDLSLFDRLGHQTAVAVSRFRLEDEVEELRVKSVTDHLTGAYNRRYLDDQLQNELERANRFEHSLSLLMIDIDDFKTFNDTLGHEAGDRILAEISTVMKQGVRAIDVLARYGGEEFVLLLPETNVQGAISIAEKLRARIEATRFSIESPEQVPQLTVTVGVATFPDMAISSRDLLHKSDLAMFEAKRMGKNTVIAWRG